MSEVEFVAARESDVELILTLIRELAQVEEFPDAVSVDAESLRRNLFGEQPAAEVLLIRVDGKAAGYAMFYHSFASTTGKRGLHLEDLYIRPAYQGRGIGKLALGRLARLAEQRQCGRFEWWVLKWNRAADGFYRGLGARKMKELRIFRLQGEEIKRVAARLGD